MGAPHIPNEDSQRVRDLAGWLCEPEQPPEKEWRPKHAQGPHYLTTIAEKWPHGAKERLSKTV
jgi:hypothetical protein